MKLRSWGGGGEGAESFSQIIPRALPQAPNVFVFPDQIVRCNNRGIFLSRRCHNDLIRGIAVKRLRQYGRPVTESWG